MALRLPLELELAIVRHAIPPLISIHRLEERVHLCLALSLVCRDWTNLVQGYLREHVTFSLCEPMAYSGPPRWDEDWASRRKQSLEEKRFNTRRICVVYEEMVKRDDEDYIEHDDVTAMVPPCYGKEGVEEMWVVFKEFCLPSWDNYPIKRLHILSQGPGIAPHFTSPPPGLVYLSFSDCDLSYLDRSQLRHLQALVLDQVWFPNSASVNALAAHPSLAILAINHRSTPNISNIFNHLPRTLEHFAYHPAGVDNEHNMDMANCPTVNLPPNLRSFTFVSSAPERYHYLTAVDVGEACRWVGAKFIHIAGRSAKDWDAEEWAYSMMA
ncbi:hypothetical protein JCM10049v2_007354 [Rhodotorula toruloides]